MPVEIERTCRSLTRGARSAPALLRWCIPIAFAACTAAVLAPLKTWAAESEIIARVNGEALTQVEFRRMRANPLTVREIQRELGVQDPDAKALDRLALRKLIHRRLMLQEASLKNLTVAGNELDNAIRALRRRFPDLRSLGEWMKEQGLDDRSLVESIRADILVDRVVAALVEDVRVTDAQVRRYYETHREELKTTEVRLQILVVKDEATANEVLTALRKGTDFASLARQRSIGRRAAKGGDTGWVDSETLWPALRMLVAKLAAGDAGGALRKGNDFYIVRLDDRRPGKTKTLVEAKPQIMSRLLATKRQDVVQAWIARQEKRAKIEVLPQPG